MNYRTGADNWLLQLAIADLAGLDWGDKARAAAIKIEGKADNRTSGVRVLADIKALFDADPEAHCMSSATMVAKLTDDPEGPWAEFARGNPLTQNRLAKLARCLQHHLPNGCATRTEDREGVLPPPI